MDPLGYAMGQLAAQSVRRQFEYEAEGEVSPTPPARIVHAARDLKRLGSLAKRLAAGGGSVPATERC
jgi:hypothetical protein